MGPIEASRREARAQQATKMLARTRASWAFAEDHARDATDRHRLTCQAVIRAASRIEASFERLPEARADHLREGLAVMRGHRVHDLPAAAPRTDELLDRVAAIWLSLASSREISDGEMASLIDEVMADLDGVVDLVRRTAPSERHAWFNDIREIDEVAAGIHNSLTG